VAELEREHGIPSLQQARMETMKIARERQTAGLGTIPPGLVDELFDLPIRYAMMLEADAAAQARDTIGSVV